MESKSLICPRLSCEPGYESYFSLINYSLELLANFEVCDWIYEFDEDCWNDVISNIILKNMTILLDPILTYLKSNMNMDLLDQILLTCVKWKNEESIISSLLTLKYWENDEKHDAQTLSSFQELIKKYYQEIQDFSENQHFLDSLKTFLNIKKN